jgi:hypothetical protein
MRSIAAGTVAAGPVQTRKTESTPSRHPSRVGGLLRSPATTSTSVGKLAESGSRDKTRMQGASWSADNWSNDLAGFLTVLPLLRGPSAPHGRILTRRGESWVYMWLCALRSTPATSTFAIGTPDTVFKLHTSKKQGGRSSYRWPSEGTAPAHPGFESWREDM